MRNSTPINQLPGAGNLLRRVMEFRREQPLPLARAGNPLNAALPAHIPALDGLRGLAILMVLCFHLTQFMPITASSVRLDRIVRGVFTLGWVGVDLFFVLSGFLITGILLDARGTPNYFRNFYMRRVLRIFPLYYAVIGFYLIVLPRVSPSLSAHYGFVYGKGIYYWLYLSNQVLPKRLAAPHNGLVGVLGPTWSLAVEEQFYMVWPFLVFLLGRENLKRLCLVTIALVVATRVTMLSHGVHWAYVATLTVCRLDTLSIGGLLACLVRRRGGPASLVRFNLPAAIVSLVIFGAIALVQQRLGQARGQMRYAFGYTVLAVLAACLLLASITASPKGWWGRLLTLRWLMMFGKYSYALYLLHLPIEEVVRRFLAPLDRLPTVAGSHLPGVALQLMLSIGIYLTVAWISWNLLEKQFLKLKRFFPLGGKHPAEPAAPAKSDLPSHVAGEDRLRPVWRDRTASPDGRNPHTWSGFVAGAQLNTRAVPPKIATGVSSLRHTMRPERGSSWAQRCAKA